MFPYHEPQKPSSELYGDVDDALSMDRFRHGLCPHCGVKCFDMESDSGDLGFHSLRVPLTIPNLVEDGRCISCHGLPSSRCSSIGKDDAVDFEGDEFAAEEPGHYLDDCEDPEAFDKVKEQSALASFLDSNSGGTGRGEIFYEGDNFNDCRSLLSSGNRVSSAMSGVSRGSGNLDFLSRASPRTSLSRKQVSSAGASDTRSIVSDDDTNVSFLGDHKPSATVIKCMKELAHKIPSSEKRCFQVLSCLYNVTNKDPENRASAMALGAAKALAECMAAHRSSVRLQVKACTLVGLLSEDNPRHQNMINKAGGIPNLVATMMAHRVGHKLLQQEATKALDILLEHPPSAEQFAMNQGVRLTHSIMFNYLSDQSIQEHCCGILYHVAKVRLDSVSSAELIEAVVVTLKRHKKARNVHANGCALFRILAQEGTQTTRNSMIWCDVVPHVLKCMKHNVSSIHVQVQGCQMLVALCCDRREARLTVAEEGLPILFDSMRKHDDDVEFLQAACQVLILASDGPTSTYVCKALAKSSGRKILERTKKNHEAHCGNLVSQLFTLCS